MVLRGPTSHPCESVGGSQVYPQGSFVCVDIYPASTAKEPSIVSPLPKLNPLLAAWNQTPGEGAGPALGVLLARDTPPRWFEGQRLSKMF